VIEEQLREHFGEAAAASQPPATISTRAAKQRARSSLRRRRAGVATLSAATVVAAALAATLPWAGKGLPSSRATGGQPSLQSPGPATFDAAGSRLSFRWLPPGIRVVTQTSTATGLSAGLAVRGSKADAEDWTVGVLTAGDCRLSRGTLRCGGQVVAYPTVRAPDVDGGVAYWGNSAPNNNFAQLSFQYAANSWAYIAYWSGPTSKWFTHASRAEILRIAGGMTRTRGATVPLPIHLAGRTGWKLALTEWMWSAFSGVSVSASVSSSTGAVTGNPSLLITRASARQTCSVYPPARHLTINGYSVVIETQAVYPPGASQTGQPELQSETLCAADAGGLMITVTLNGTRRQSSLTSLFSHLRPGPDASSWTGEPPG
jgi:hypothetical protein